MKIALEAFSVYDEKAQIYSAPFFMGTIGQAMRTFGDACEDPQNQFSKHPEDFTLYHVGTFDQSAGELTGQVPVFVAKATQFRKDG